MAASPYPFKIPSWEMVNTFVEVTKPGEKLSVMEIANYIATQAKPINELANGNVDYAIGFNEALLRVLQFINTRHTEDKNKQIKEINDNCC